MSYENRFILKLKNTPTTKKVNFCPKCEKLIDGKFCSICGTELIKKDIPVDCTTDIISEFRDVSEDANHLLKNDGTTENEGSGHSIDTDLLEFSKKYPSIIFELFAYWDPGFGESPSKIYFMDGKKQIVKGKIVFDEFDINKLKTN